MSSSSRFAPDDWTTEGSVITSPGKIEAVRKELEERGPVLVKHWHYRGGRCPTHIAFDEIDSYLDYLKTEARPGDAFDIWALGDLIKGLGTLAEGKMPDEDGAVPRRGSY